MTLRPKTFKEVLVPRRGQNILEDDMASESPNVVEMMDSPTVDWISHIKYRDETEALVIIFNEAQLARSRQAQAYSLIGQFRRPQLLVKLLEQ